MSTIKQRTKIGKTDATSAREMTRAEVTAGPAALTPTDLHLSNRSSLSEMSPGDIIFLDDFAYLRESFATNFVAILSCPQCGSPSLITSVQYSGGAPIVCTSKVCPGLFRIIDESQIVALHAC